MKRHIILLGLPGSGKSTVGTLVASALRAPFVDLDQVIADRAGQTISQIFADHGESGFRLREREEMRRTLSGKPSVVAAGGGWAAQPSNPESAGPRGLTVYLRVPPEVAASRAAGTPGARPLLSGGADIKEEMIALLRAREAHYERSDATVDASVGDPHEVAAQVVSLARSLGGWY